MRTIDEVAAETQERNPQYKFGIAREKGLIGILSAGEWVQIHE